MRRRHRRALAAVVCLPLLGPGGAPPEPALDAGFPSGRATLPLAELLARPGLAPDAGFKLEELGRDAHSSHHLVWIRDREVPHRHDAHDLFVVILKGYGGMRLGDEERPVGPGSILYVPRATVHAFRNTSPEPAVAYAVYAPPFDGRDRQEVD